MLTSQLHYDLPPERIATHPAEPRDAAKLLVINRQNGVLTHHCVRDLPEILAQTRPADCPGDLLVVNQSKVLPARIAGYRKATRGHITGLYLDSPNANQWQVMLESRGKLQPDEIITLGETEDHQLSLLVKLDGGKWIAELTSPLSTVDLLEQIGKPPLPPYILKQRKHDHESIDADDDPERYNTVYASEAGSVAAPTAGLHFTDHLLRQLQSANCEIAKVTLHVGLGTFAPVRVDNLEDHPMHSEHIAVPAQTLATLNQARAQGKRIIPIGTTSVRTLESLPGNWQRLTDDYNADTQLFIMPKTNPEDRFQFRFTDAMMTNFHLPESTLLALVAALPGVGIDNLLSYYQTAIDHQYRFYSYGDAMLLI